MTGTLRYAVLVLVAVPATAQTSPAQDPNVFYCTYVASENQADRDREEVDLVMTRRPKTPNSTETWLLRWPDKPEYDALAFDIDFGSHGGSRGLQWKDEDNKLQRGFISFSDIVAESGSLGLWFALDRPSLWQAPGYGCETDVAMLSGAQS